MNKFLCYSTASILVSLVLASVIMLVQASINANTLIRDCQASLPRDQYCELVAVPIESEESNNEQ